MSIRSASARGDRSTVNTFNVRSSGRDLSAVRRPVREVATETPEPEPEKTPLPKSSASKPAKNDGAVKTKKSDG